MERSDPIHVVGGGLAGSEAAWQVAEAGLPVVLHEMRPAVGTFAHKTGGLAELVCSNSFRSDDDEQNAVGLLHWEMRAADHVDGVETVHAPHLGQEDAGEKPEQPDAGRCQPGWPRYRGSSSQMLPDLGHHLDQRRLKPVDLRVLPDLFRGVAGD